MSRQELQQDDSDSSMTVGMSTVLPNTATPARETVANLHDPLQEQHSSEIVGDVLSISDHIDDTIRLSMVDGPDADTPLETISPSSSAYDQQTNSFEMDRDNAIIEFSDPTCRQFLSAQASMTNSTCYSKTLYEAVNGTHHDNNNDGVSSSTQNSNQQQQSVDQQIHVSNGEPEEQDIQKLKTEVSDGRDDEIGQPTLEDSDIKAVEVSTTVLKVYSRVDNEEDVPHPTAVSSTVKKLKQKKNKSRSKKKKKPSSGLTQTVKVDSTDLDSNRPISIEETHSACYYSQSSTTRTELHESHPCQQYKQLEPVDEYQRQFSGDMDSYSEQQSCQGHSNTTQRDVISAIITESHTSNHVQLESDRHYEHHGDSRSTCSNDDFIVSNHRNKASQALTNEYRISENVLQSLTENCMNEQVIVETSQAQSAEINLHSISISDDSQQSNLLSTTKREQRSTADKLMISAAVPFSREHSGKASNRSAEVENLEAKPKINKRMGSPQELQIETPSNQELSNKTSNVFNNVFSKLNNVQVTTRDEGRFFSR